MRILLDECLPRKLKNDLVGYDVKTVPKMGWAGKKNGELLRLIDGCFDVFVTADQNLNYQQNLKGRDFTIFVIKAPNSRYETLKPAIPIVCKKLNLKPSSTVIEIDLYDN